MTNFLQSTLEPAPSQSEEDEDDSHEAIVTADFACQEVASVTEGITTTCEKEDDVENGEDNRV